MRTGGRCGGGNTICTEPAIYIVSPTRYGARVRGPHRTDTVPGSDNGSYQYTDRRTDGRVLSVWGAMY